MIFFIVWHCFLFYLLYWELSCRSADISKKNKKKQELPTILVECSLHVSIHLLVTWPCTTQLTMPFQELSTIVISEKLIFSYTTVTILPALWKHYYCSSEQNPLAIKPFCNHFGEDCTEVWLFMWSFLHIIFTLLLDTTYFGIHI